MLDRISAPTLLIQGTQDSLFGLGQADANARGIAANGTPVSVVWYDGGHDASASDGDTADLRDLVAGWFDVHLRGTGEDRGTAFTFPVPAGVGAATGRVQGGTKTETAPAYPGLDGDPVTRTDLPLSRPHLPGGHPAGRQPRGDHHGARPRRGHRGPGRDDGGDPRPVRRLRLASR